MNIKMNKIDQRRKFLKEKAYSLYKKISSVFNLTSVDLMNNFLFFIFGYMIYSLISNQISNSSFITAHILSWDSYVYMCGVSLFLNGMEKYSTHKNTFGTPPKIQERAFSGKKKPCGMLKYISRH